jgi:hypothetical protein
MSDPQRLRLQLHQRRTILQEKRDFLVNWIELQATSRIYTKHPRGVVATVVGKVGKTIEDLDRDIEKYLFILGHHDSELLMAYLMYWRNDG